MGTSLYRFLQTYSPRLCIALMAIFTKILVTVLWLEDSIFASVSSIHP